MLEIKKKKYEIEEPVQLRDEDNNLLCGISNKAICDLNGNIIASFVRKERV